MISQLSLTNFKSIKGRTEVNLKPYTFIYGPNSAGKSSLIQSLLLLSHSNFNEVNFRSGTLDLGTFTNAISGQTGGYEQTFKVGVGFSAGVYKGFIEFEICRNSSPGKERLGKFKELNLSLTSSSGATSTTTFRASQPKVLRLSSLNNPRWKLTDPESIGDLAGFRIMNPDRLFGVLPLFFGDSKDDVAVRTHLGLPSHLTQDMSRDFRDFFKRPLEEICDMAHIPPVRNIPPELFIDDLRSGDTNSLSFYNELAKDVSALDNVNNALDRLEMNYKLIFNEVGSPNLNPRIQRVGSFTLSPVNLKLRLGFQDVGHGVSQVVPVLAAVFSKRKLISIEQPELHLHPRLQGQLADVLISAHEIHNSQFLIETHSESLMLRFQRKVRDEKISADDVKILYVNPEGNGFSFVSEIDLDKNGNFSAEWPEGFFEDRFEDIF